MRITRLLLLAAAAVAAVIPTPKPEGEEEAPAPCPEISGKEWETTVAEGTYWVKFYSPQCGHCQMLAPKWERMYQEIGNDVASRHDFHIAAVNCLADGDLCNQENINVYPTLNLYKNGKKVETYDLRKGTQPSRLAKFVEEKIKEASGISKLEGDEEKIASTKKANVNVEGLSVDLNPTNFKALVSDDPTGWYIKYYLPSCPHCVAMDDAWNEVAAKFKNQLNVGEINCAKYADFCRGQGIEYYPAVTFQIGELSVTYNGERTTDALTLFGLQAVEARDMKSVNQLEFEELRQKHPETVSYIYLHDEALFPEDLQALQKFAINVVAHANVYKSDDKKLVDKFSVTRLPALVAVNNDYTDEMSFEVYPEYDVGHLRNSERLLQFARRTWLPLMPELTPINQDSVFADGRIVVLALVDREDKFATKVAIDELKQSATKYFKAKMHARQKELDLLRIQRHSERAKLLKEKDPKLQKKLEKDDTSVPTRPQVQFAWIDADKYSKWIESRFRFNWDDRKANAPIIVIDDAKNVQFFDTDDKNARLEPSDAEQLARVLDLIEKNNSRQLFPRSTRGFFASWFIFVWGLKTYILLVFVLLAVAKMGKRYLRHRRSAATPTLGKWE